MKYTMDNTRLILIILHVLITIFLIYNLHHHLPAVGKSKESAKQISSIIAYINDLFRISFYHSSCILAIYYSRRYAAGMIRATGVLLIGEFLQILTLVIQHMAETHHIPIGDLLVHIIYVWLFFFAIILTYQLAKKISKRHKDLMQVELLTTTTSDMFMDEGGDRRGEFAIV